MGSRVWTLGELDILNEIHKPIAVIASGVYHSPHSPGGLADVARVLFQNVECHKRFGPPRTLGECKAIMENLTEAERQARRGWLLRAVQGQEVHQSWTDINSLLRPIFQGISSNFPKRCVRIDSKPIRVQTAQGNVEEALVHTAELGADIADMRATAVHDRDPMHTMIFTAQGTLLHANKAALESLCQHSVSGVEEKGVVTMKTLFDQGLYSGGEDECQAAYEEAVDAIFSLKVDCHRHVQSHMSRKDGNIKWSALEMWPMQDPIEVCPAVLVKRYDITQQKELELQLAQQQVGLHRQNQLLEEASASMQQEQDRLQHQASSLADQLQAVLQEKRHRRRLSFDAETPVDKTLNYLQSVISGQAQSSDTALELFNLLSSSDTKLRQPVGLEMQLMQDMRMDSDVSRSMLQLLQGGGKQSEKPSSEEESGPLVTTVSISNAVQYGPVAQPTSLPVHSSMDQAASFLPVSVTPALERMLQDAENNWQFDVFAFSEAAPRNTLCLLTCHLFKRAGLIDDFGLDTEKLCRYLQRIEAGYSAANSYHNGTHATAVVQMTHMILRHGGAMPDDRANALYVASAYWSAAVHDFEHGGVNNDFLIKTAHPLAITYNDQSPLENHHLAAATLENLKPQPPVYPGGPTAL
ncbi:hypothetical protein WJX79_001991 [Trebouxia sp. C0005]